MAHGLVLAILLLLLAWDRPARADERLRFEVEATPEARTCEDREVLRAKIAERLGREPFATDDAARGRLRVAFAREARAFTAEIVLFDTRGERVGGRTLSQPGPTCDALVASVVFTVAVLLEDLAPTAPATPGPAAAPPLTPEPQPDEPSPPPPPHAEPPRVRIDASLGATGALGGAPAAAVGAEAVVGLDVSRFRIELAGRTYLPASSDGDVGVRSRLIYGRVAPCYGLAVVSACLLVAVGSISGEATGSGVAAARTESDVFAAAGLGALSRLFVVNDVLFVRGSLDVLFSLARAGFDVGNQRVWSVPPISAAATLGLGARLP